MQRRADPGNPEDSVYVQYVAGTLALTERDPRSALVAFGRTKGFRFPAALALQPARAYEQLGQLDSAAILLREIVALPAFGYEDQIAWTRALIDVGDVLERLGRRDEAIDSYRRFLEQWKGADPGLPDVGLVRARLTALLGRRDR
jgi:tetratricopeptide (TPR) repeat protein